MLEYLAFLPIIGFSALIFYYGVKLWFENEIHDKVNLDYFFAQPIKFMIKDRRTDQ